MNKKVLPLFSLLLMLALAVTSFVPAQAARYAPSAAGSPSSVIAYSEPVNLTVTYNAATREIVVTPRFVNKALKVVQGNVFARNTSGSWRKTTQYYSQNAPTLKYKVPPGKMDYCVSVHLYGYQPAPLLLTGVLMPDDPLPIQGLASKCVTVLK